MRSILIMWSELPVAPLELPTRPARRFASNQAIVLALVAHLAVLLVIYYSRSIPNVRADRFERDRWLNVEFKLTQAEFEGDSGGARAPDRLSSPVPESPGALSTPSARPKLVPRTTLAEPVVPPTSGPAEAAKAPSLDVSSLREDGRPVTAGSGLRQALRDFDRRMTEQREPAVAGAGRTGPGGGTSFVPDLGAVPPTGLGVGELVFESRDFDWRDYGKQVYIAIWRAWHNRLWATTNEFEKWSHRTGQWYLRHQVRVGFVIESSGAVSGIVIDDESGVEALDLSATDALAEVILPPLPKEFPRDREVVHGQFLAEGEVQSMRPTLKRFKQAGWF